MRLGREDTEKQLHQQFVNTLDHTANSPVLPQWADYLWSAGDRRQQIEALPAADCRNLLVYRPGPMVGVMKETTLGLAAAGSTPTTTSALW